MGARRRAVFLAAVLLFLPSLVRANSLASIGDKTLFVPDANVYRLRLPAKPWQLVGLPTGLVPERYEIFNSQFFLLGGLSGQKTLYRSADGLRFVPINLTADQINLKIVGDSLLVALETAGTVSLRKVDATFTIETVPPGPLTAISELDRLIELNGQLLMVKQATQAEVYAFGSSIWQLTATLPCTSSTPSYEPLVSVRCSDQVYYAQSAQSWLPLFPAAIRQVVGEERLLAQGNTSPTTFYLFSNGLVSMLTLTGFGNPDTVVLAEKNNRFFLRGDVLWELIVTPTPELVQADSSPTAALVPAENSARIYLRRSGRDAASDLGGVWQEITVAGDFDRARQVSNGWLLWKQNGSLTQFASTDQTTYQQIATSWAASSRIQEILSVPTGGALLYLYNSTNKPNLYKTANFSQWTRITLPSEPTIPAAISDARALPAGSLIDVVGVITAGSGVVSGDTLYLQDQTGGIQIFLSSTKGVLPTGNQRAAEAVGEISTAQTKRIILDDADDLLLGDAAAVVFPPTAAADAIGKLGWSLAITGKITAKTNDYLSLEAAAAAFRLHYKTLVATYVVGDSGSFPAVVDYNSSSGQTEAWLIGPDVLTDHPASAAAPVIVPTAATDSADVGTASEATPVQPPQKAGLKSSVIIEPIAEVTSVSALSSLPDQALVAPASTSNRSTGVPPREVLVMSLLSLAAGLLSLRGRRFRRFIAP